jgi:hypothetical protein
MLLTLNNQSCSIGQHQKKVRRMAVLGLVLLLKIGTERGLWEVEKIILLVRKTEVREVLNFLCGVPFSDEAGKKLLFTASCSA